MPGNMSNRRVSFSPDVGDLFTNHHGGGGSKKRVVTTGTRAYHRSRKTAGFSPVELLKRIGAKMSRTLRLISKNGKSLRKVSTSSSCSTLARSRSYAESFDSHRTEAIEDCIEFLNSSSSFSSSCFHRSNSVSTIS